MKKLFLIPLVFSSLALKAEEPIQSERELYCNEFLDTINMLKEVKQLAITDNELKAQYRLKKLELAAAKEQTSISLAKLRQPNSLEAKDLISELKKRISKKIQKVNAQEGYTDQETIEEMKSLIDNAGTQPILEKVIHGLEENIKLIDNQLKNFPSEEKFIAIQRNNMNMEQTQINKQIKRFTEMYNYCINEKNNSENNSSAKPHQHELKLEVPKLFKAFEQKK